MRKQHQKGLRPYQNFIYFYPLNFKYILSPYNHFDKFLNFNQIQNNNHLNIYQIMYEYIEGSIRELTPTYAVIDNQGIGYYIHIALSAYSELTSKKQAKVYIHQVVREDANLLYGFASITERIVFRLLISVSGIGANTALIMLSSMSAGEISNAIVTDNVNALKSIKGIGLKTAQRTIIELKDKMSKVLIGEDTELFDQPSNTIREESLSALVMLGFKKPAAEKIIDKIMKQNKDITIEELVKNALKQL